MIIMDENKKRSFLGKIKRAQSHISSSNSKSLTTLHKSATNILGKDKQNLLKIQKSFNKITPLNY